MSDTTTPSAAEVMGWHLDGDLWIRPNPSPQRSLYQRTGPTPDDMLAWLHDAENERHGWTLISIQPPGPHNGWAVLIQPWVGDFYEEYDAPTLHAALEQAVIAVGRGL